MRRVPLRAQASFDGMGHSSSGAALFFAAHADYGFESLLVICRLSPDFPPTDQALKSTLSHKLSLSTCIVI